MRLAAAEEMREETREVRVHLLEGFEHALAALAVQARNSLAELRDGADEILALARHRLELLGEFARFFLGAEVDAAEAFSLALQAVELRVDLLDGRKLGAFLEIGLGERRRGLAFERFADALFRFAQAFARAFDETVDAGTLLARLAEMRLEFLGELRAFRKLRFRLGERVGRRRTAGFRFRDVVEKGDALLLDLCGNAFEDLQFAQRFRLALLERHDLAFGVLGAMRPGFAFLRDGGETARACVGFAAQAFVLRAGLGKFEAERRDAVAQFVCAAAQILVRLQRGEGDLALFERARRFAHVAGEALMRFGERREARELRGGGALGGGEGVADAVVLGLRFALGAARVLLAAESFFRRDACVFESGAGLGGEIARALEFGFEVGQAVPLFEPARGGGRRIGGGGVAVPAPERALAGDEALAGLQLGLETLAVRRLDHADLREPARERCGAAHEIRKRDGALGKRGRDVEGRQRIPVHRRCDVARHGKIVAHGGAERRLETVFDLHRVDHGRPEVRLADCEEIGERLRLGGEVARAALGDLHRLARRFFRVLRGGARFLRVERGIFRRFHAGGGGLEFARLEIDLGLLLGGVGERGLLGHDVLDLAGEALDARLARFDRLFEALALRSQAGDLAIEFVEFAFARPERGLRLGDARFGDRLRLRLAFLGGAEFFRFRFEAGDGAARILDQVTLAAEVVADLFDACVEALRFFLRARFLGVEIAALDGETVETGRRLRLRVAQRGQRFRRIGLGDGRGGDVARQLGDARVGRSEALFLMLQRVDGLRPLQMELDRFRLADLARKVAVAHGLARLALEARELRFELRDDVVEARQIGLGGLEAELRLVAARVEAGDAGGFFENAAAVDRLRGNELRDLALPDERGRMGAGRGVGEEKLNVAGAHLAAIDAIGRAFVALDLARHLDRLAVVIGGGRRAVGIVDDEHDLGVVARRTARRAGEDHVFHAGAAHVLERILAHDPAQCFEEVRLAASVRADNARQARLDDQIGRIDEGFEA